MRFVENYLKSVRFEFRRYKTLGDRTFEQLNEKDCSWMYGDGDNSIALIVKHMAGNMLSRWTNFLIEDGEKPWRDRESEFRNPPKSKKELLRIWENGWNCLFHALDTIDSDNFDTIVKIRNQEHTIIEAVNRQLAHYANHVGQIVLLAKMFKGTDWEPLSIPLGGSDRFNSEKFSP